MKIQSIIPLSILLLTVSACSEKPAAEQEASGIPQTLVAEIADDFTKTAFLTDADGNENSRFTWLAGDRFKMLLTDNTFATYEATADGRSASFKLLDPNITVNAIGNMGKFSVYPADIFDFEDGEPVVFLKPDYSAITNGTSDMLSTVPIIANNFFQGYSMFTPYLLFHVATAVLKVDIENVPSVGIVWALISHPSYPLGGLFRIADDAHIYAYNRLEGFPFFGYSVSCLPAGNVSLFIPVPLGEMTAGLEVRVYQHEDGKEFAVATTNKAIKLEAGKGYDLGAVRCHDVDTQTTVAWNGKTITIEKAEGTQAVEVAWLPNMYYSNCSLYDQSAYNSLWLPRRTRFEASGTYPFDLPPAQEALCGSGNARTFALVYRTIDEDGFDYYHLVWRGQIPDELYEDVDLSWSKVDVGFGS